MSFVDMAYLRKNNLRNGIIRYYRKKTGGRLEIKITPAMQEIIDYFSPMVKASPYVFPIISDSRKPHRTQYETGLTTQNRLLKELARLAGTGVKLSTHMARHSWATLAKEEDLPLWVISEGLGHNNEQTTYIYLSQLERSVLDSANERIYKALTQKTKHADKNGRKIINSKKVRNTEILIPLYRR
ncbi:hypothetical protein D0T84_22405 [Dysgonomonas sp. 521]|uniref:tyrosine-type recombinase/integrase n=1 Tax=Dysgonomonas sp. 521 TaxID=2302932 RepID=UPI0013D78750|nr:tyrosine-type recombinase/integrase [Dysgonomonas sp. 521]NDV97611.1 hypothetical protein [Dysgonomonas sp. 521]